MRRDALHAAGAADGTTDLEITCTEVVVLYPLGPGQFFSNNLKRWMMGTHTSGIVTQI